MSDAAKESGGRGPSHRGVEIGVAAFMALLALIGIYGSLKVGIGWGAEGPKAGFFPFYVNLAVIIACAVNLAKVLASADEGELFAGWDQLKLVLAVVIPTAIYSLTRHLCRLNDSDRGLHEVVGALSLDLRDWCRRARAVPDVPDVRVVVSRPPAEGAA